jgi:hypothetical protein
MLPLLETHKSAEKLLAFLAVFGYLTAEQLRKVCGYQPKSIRYIRGKLNSLVAAKFAIALPGRFVTQPRVYTLTQAGYTYAAALGIKTAKRVRPAEERDKARNRLFIEHTLAVSDVLINAWLLAHTHPGITLTNLYTERELQRKIYVQIPERICIEPDASCEFTSTETWHETPQTWQDFLHIEVYRHRPLEPRFKQKITGYVAAVDAGVHEALFHTQALSVAVMCATKYQATTLKRWTEEALQAMGRVAEGERFFFRQIDPATASPEELFLSPVWEQAFSTAKTPLLLLDEETDEAQTNQ